MRVMNVINKRGSQKIKGIKDFEIDRGNLVIELDSGEFKAFGEGSWYEFWTEMVEDDD